MQGRRGFRYYFRGEEHTLRQIPAYVFGEQPVEESEVLVGGDGEQNTAGG